MQIYIYVLPPSHSPKRESFFACIVVHLLLGNLTAIPTWLRVSHLKRNYSPQSPWEEQSESPESLDFTDYVHSHPDQIPKFTIT